METHPQSINDYQLTELIGEGSFAKVYLGINHKNKKYALKVIETKQIDQEHIREEGLLLASIKHKNIVWAKQFFFFNKDREFVIVIDYCSDGGLDKKIGKLSMASVVKIMGGIADGLRFLHIKKQIMHRDIKLENVLLDGDTAKIADLGISKVMPSRHESSVVGSTNYMAPEVFEGDYQYGCDIWALGIIYLELLTGKRVYQLIGIDYVPAKMEYFPSEKQLNLIQDEKYRQLVKKMLVRNPKKRINIQQVCLYFDFLDNEPMSPVKQGLKNTQRQEQSWEAVNETYGKVKQLILGKINYKFFKQFLEKNMISIEQQAQEGNKKGQYLMGKMYHQGYSMPLNLKQAQNWYLKAYQQEEPYCCYELHLLTDSQRQKKHYLQNGKLLDQIRCQLAIAEYHIQAKFGFALDYQQAYYIAEQLCECMYPRAFLIKGQLCTMEKTQFSNPEQALKAYQRGVQLGDEDCRLALMSQYCNQKMYAEAKKEGKHILKNNDDLSTEQQLLIFHTLAKTHANLKQELKAIDYYKKCIKIAPPEIEIDYRGELAQLCEKIGNHKDAIYYYNEAVYTLIPKRQNSDFFRQRLRVLCQKLYIILVDQGIFSDAFMIAELAASLGFQAGKADYGYMIYSGLGVNQDKEKGLGYLLKLAQQGNNEAFSYLVDIKNENQL